MFQPPAATSPVALSESGSMHLSRNGRGGRPGAHKKGEIDERILEASTTLFLANGFDGTTFDQIAELSHSGKASIYARYSGKQQLFIAVVRRNVERTMDRTPKVSMELSLHDRLIAVGLSIMKESLVPNCVRMMRVVIAESERLPVVAAQANLIGFEHSVRLVAETISANDQSKQAIKRATPAATKFVELTFMPLLLHALMGRDPRALLKETPRRIKETIKFLEASLALTGWT